MSDARINQLYAVKVNKHDGDRQGIRKVKTAEQSSRQIVVTMATKQHMLESIYAKKSL